MSLSTVIEFNVGGTAEARATVEWIVSDLPPGAALELQFPRLEIAASMKDSLKGVSRIERPGLFAAMLYFIATIWYRLLRFLGLRKGERPPFSPVKYVAVRGAPVVLSGILLRPERSTAVKMKVHWQSPPEPGSVHTVQVIQRQGRLVTGGSTFRLLGPALKGITKRRPFDEDEFSRREEEGREEPEDWLPPLIIAWNRPNE
jgi:hypothetical protein